MSLQSGSSGSMPARPERSALGRLFQYSKDNEKVALENFVTEALAIAIRSSPAPFLTALGRAEVLGNGLAQPAGDVTVLTQVCVAGAFLDLTLAYADERGEAVEVWVEVKVDAVESGQQLKAYARHGTALARTCRPHFVVLSKVPLSGAEGAGFRCLSWAALFAVAHEHPRATERWMDLLDFLEEQQVANTSELPITDAEAASLAAAHGLISKVGPVLTEVNQQIGNTWPQHPLKWKNDGPLLNQIAIIFRGKGKMMASHGPLFVGMELAGGNAHWTIAVLPDWVGKKGIANLAGLDLPSDWVREPGASVPLAKRVRATACPDRKTAVEWFAAGLRELKAAGVVDDLLAGASVQLASGDGVTVPE